MGAPRSGFFCLGWAFLTPLSVTPNGIIDLRPITGTGGVLSFFAHTNSREGAFRNVFASCGGAFTPRESWFQSGPRSWLANGPGFRSRPRRKFPASGTPAKSRGIGADDREALQLATVRRIERRMYRLRAPLDEEREQAIAVVVEIERLPVQHRSVRTGTRTWRRTLKHDAGFSSARQLPQCQRYAPPNRPASVRQAASTSRAIRPASLELLFAPGRARSLRDNAADPVTEGHCAFLVPDASTHRGPHARCFSTKAIPWSRSLQPRSR